MIGTNKIVQEQEKALLERFKISDNELMTGEGESKIGKFSINLPFAVVDAYKRILITLDSYCCSVFWSTYLLLLGVFLILSMHI